MTPRLLNVFIFVLLNFTALPFAKAALPDSSFTHKDRLFRLIVEDPQNSLGDRLPLLIVDLKAALEEWNRVIPLAAALDIKVQMINVGEGRVDGASLTNKMVRERGNWKILEEGAAYKIRTGLPVDPDQADILIRINPKSLNEDDWMDPHPEQKNPVPPDKVDFVSILKHEIGHAIGFQSFRNAGKGKLDGEFMSGLDEQMTLTSAGKFLFMGHNAQKVFGGPVPFTTTNASQNFSHYGNAGDSETLVDGLMSGVRIYRGRRYEISPLDRAILKDMGLPVKDEPSL